VTAWAAAALDALKLAGSVTLEMTSVVLMPIPAAVLIPILAIPAPIAVEDLTIIAIIVGRVVVVVGDLGKSRAKGAND